MGSTLGTLVANVALSLGDSALAFYTAPELKMYIGRSYKKYFMIMNEAGAGYFCTQINLGFTANSEELDLATLTPSFFNIKTLKRNTVIGTVPLDPSENRQSVVSPYLAGAGYLYQPSYRLRGMKLILEPQPMTTEVPTSATGLSTTGLCLNYISQPTFPTSASADNFTFSDNFPLAFEPVIELDAAISALEAKDVSGGLSDIQTLRNNRDIFEQTMNNNMERDENPLGIPYSGWDYATGGF